MDTVDGQERLTLAVSDTGQGMSPQDVEGVFDEFYRAKRDLGHVEGTGLGLAITRKICRLLGGDVTVESRLHEGSTFTIRLPRSPEVEPPESTEADASDLVAACG